MNTRRTPARRVDQEVIEGIPPWGEQVPQGGQAPLGVQVPQGEQVSIVGQWNEVPVVSPDMTNGEIKEALLILARAMTTQVNRDAWPKVNALQSTMTCILCDFVWMNPPTFLVSKVGEKHKEFLDCLYKVLSSMGVTCREKAELACTNWGNFILITSLGRLSPPYRDSPLHLLSRLLLPLYLLWVNLHWANRITIRNLRSSRLNRLKKGSEEWISWISAKGCPSLRGCYAKVRKMDLGFARGWHREKSDPSILGSILQVWYSQRKDNRPV